MPPNAATTQIHDFLLTDTGGDAILVADPPGEDLGMRRSLRILSLVTLVGGVSAANAQAQVPATPTFTKNVAAIFQEKCEACHRADSIAPMSLITYEESRPWARSIRDRVTTRQMPPWHVSKTVGIQHPAEVTGSPDTVQPDGTAGAIRTLSTESSSSRRSADTSACSLTPSR